MKSINPFSNKPIAEYPEYKNYEISEILNKAVDAFISWKNTSFEVRINLILKVAEKLRINKDIYARTITLEMGKPVSESKAEVEKCAWVCEYYAENAEKHLEPEIINTEARHSRVQYEPLGPILGIMPWNFPFWQVFRFLAPNIMAGNVTLLKHASNVQGCARHIEDIFNECNYPTGVFQNVVISSSGVKEIIEHSSIKAVTLTGSEYAGSTVASQAGKCIKKTVLELGGSNAFIVLDDANIDEAVREGVTARMMNCGQSCIAAKRFIVHNSVYNDFVKKFSNAIKKLVVGNPLEEKTQIGPLSSLAQAKEVEKQVNDSLKQGAKIETGGTRNECFYLPTVLTNVTAETTVFKEEVFGPVAPVIGFNTDEEAVQLANSSEFGLGATIFTNSFERAEKLIPEIEDGAVFINSLVKSDPRLPFGGTKKSGYGRELSLLGIREFVNAKTVFFAK